MLLLFSPLSLSQHPTAVHKRTAEEAAAAKFLEKAERKLLQNRQVKKKSYRNISHQVSPCFSFDLMRVTFLYIGLHRVLVELLYKHHGEDGG